MAPPPEGGTNRYILSLTTGSEPLPAQDRELDVEDLDPKEEEEDALVEEGEPEPTPGEEEALPVIDVDAAATAHGTVLDPDHVADAPMLGDGFHYDTSDPPKATWSAFNLDEQIHWKRARTLNAYEYYKV